jgi:glucans biosynthesis protein C
METSLNRYHYLDWLRVLGVLLLIPFHVALIFVFDPYTIMYIRDEVNSPVLASMTGFIHLWHMPILFFIAGSATYYSLNFRSPAQYIRERISRLLVPLLFGIFTYIPFTIYIQHSNLFSMQAGYIRFFQIDFAHIDGMTGTFTPAHLWFILFLFVYSTVGVPILLTLQRSDKFQKRVNGWVAVTNSPLRLSAWGIPLVIAAATGILGDMNPIYYFLIFFYGYLIASHINFQEAIKNFMWAMLSLGLFAGAVNVVLPVYRFEVWSPQWIVLGFIYQMGRWWLTLAILGLGHRFLNFTNKALQYASEAAMPFYLLHMTFSVITGYFIVQLNLFVAIKYLLIVLSATIFTWLTYELVKRWNVARWLFGMKPIKSIIN